MDNNSDDNALPPQMADQSEIVNTLLNEIAQLRLRMEDQEKRINEQTAGQNGENTSQASREDPSSPRVIKLDDLQAIQHILRKETHLENIEPYLGGKDYEAFIEATLNAQTSLGWSEKETYDNMVKKLKDKAKTEFYSLRQNERPSTVEKLRQWIRRVFGERKQQAEGRRKLLSCVKSPDESLGAFAQRLRVLSTEAFPDDENKADQITYRNKLLVEQFIQGIDLRLANKIIEKGDFYLLEEVLEVAEKYEATISKQLSANLHQNRYSTQICMVQGTSNVDEAMGTQNIQNCMKPDVPYKQNETRLTGNNYPNYPRYNNGSHQPKSKRNGNQERGPCFNCNELGHFARTCPKPNVLICHYCKRIGHKGKNCYFWQRASKTHPN